MDVTLYLEMFVAFNMEHRSTTLVQALPLLLKDRLLKAMPLLAKLLLIPKVMLEIQLSLLLQQLPIHKCQ